MGWVRRASVGQRVVLSVGLAAALVIGGAWWIVGDYLTPSGWFSYAPGTSTDTYIIVRERDAAHLVIGLGADAIWVGISLVLFGGRSPRSSDDA